MEARVQRCPRNVTGEAFISQFLIFIDRRGWQLLSDRSALKLQPRCLEYLATRLCALRELLEIKSSNPIEYFTGAAADLDDYKRLHKVQNFLEATRHLELHSSARGIRDPTPINLSPFRSLKTLELRGCDLSSQCAIGLENLRDSLEKIVCSDTLEALSHLLDPPLCSADDAQRCLWPKLEELSCMYNNISEMDASLKLVPNVRVLDLSRNSISRVANVGDLSNLVALDLSHNRLSSIEPVFDTCLVLQRLILKGNGVSCLAGIEDLECLEELDMRWNLVGNFKEVLRVAKLPEIRKLGMEGNPLALLPTYRVQVLSCFPDAECIELDEEVTSETEIRKAKRAAVADLADKSSGSWDHTPIGPLSFTSSIRTLWQSLLPLWSGNTPKWQQPSSISIGSPTSSSETDSVRTPHRARRRVVDFPSMDVWSAVVDRKSCFHTDYGRRGPTVLPVAY